VLEVGATRKLRFVAEPGEMKTPPQATITSLRRQIETADGRDCTALCYKINSTLAVIPKRMMTMLDEQSTTEVSQKLPWHKPVVREMTPSEALAEGEISPAEAFACGAPPALDGDPGPDRTWRITVHVPEYVSRDKVRAFESVLRAQGDYNTRLAALDQAAYRVRADKTVTARAYRAYDATLDVSKGQHRCCLLDLDKIAIISGIPDRSVASKVFSELEDGGHVAILRFTDGPLGAPSARRLFVAPIVTAEDRAQVTSQGIYAAANAAKVETRKKRAEDARRRRNALGVNDGVVDAATTTRSGRHVNDGVVEIARSVVDETQIRSVRGGISIYQDTKTKELDHRAAAGAASPPKEAEADEEREALTEFLTIRPEAKKAFADHLLREWEASNQHQADQLTYVYLEPISEHARLALLYIAREKGAAFDLEHLSAADIRMGTEFVERRHNEMMAKFKLLPFITVAEDGTMTLAEDYTDENFATYMELLGERWAGVGPSMELADSTIRAELVYRLRAVPCATEGDAR
jgi:hypothetical protein